MWLPGAIYESLPYAYVVGGVLFIGGTLYIGIQSVTAPLYIATGLLSIVYGIYIIALRMTARAAARDLKNTWHA